MDLKEKIRVIDGFPVDGISFKDITTLLKDAGALNECINQMAERFKDTQVDIIVGPESRGFILATPLAYVMNTGFVPVRKPGKLPGETIKYEYSLEYGMDSLEIHKDAIKPGQKVLIIDDLLATGGTMFAAAKLVEKLGGDVVGLGFLIELEDLNGREKLSDYKVESLVKYN
ncbi:Adenine phosphoribosyltransferase [bioreactor metagenome]|jgi:adenine phosphoribosyltransferase|uniref:Adenine phosphoribosyltransferase n=2 Tax=root TaxID=1 RepID=A0A562J9R7_9FIRM|nr:MULTISPECIES: adenine phosphoribosyltransferase [Sedimentibacter]MEA5095736.1 adenine phosphoribosyltransferase [Sedimentibacter saalensis]TWH79793.1 adenine phosphoribosyltransferase [Sedimentibacter saalensis]